MTQKSDFRRVIVLGGGAWGTALALVAARAGRDAIVWARDTATIEAINETGTNPRYLPDITFEGEITATDDAGFVTEADIVIASIPAQAMRGVLTELAPHIAAGTPIISAAKGLERGTQARMTEVIAESAPQGRAAILSGPSFASDVARGLPTALTIATEDAVLAEQLAQALASPTFRPYAATDVIGVELGGALKNVIAIAAGIVAGAQLGASAQAALIARGFAEMSRLAAELGALPSTLMGLSGLGDLVLSTGSTQSRNFALGHAIGAGKVVTTGQPGAKLAEGAFTAGVAIELAEKLGLDLPVSHAVADVLSGQLDVSGAVERLMTRPLKAE